jgi:hypothetical protein
MGFFVYECAIRPVIRWVTDQRAAREIRAHKRRFR